MQQDIPFLQCTDKAVSLYLIPGSSAPLERICVGGDNLLLIYSDGKARLWDIKSQEFWRSMARAKADDLLEQGGWFEV
jgi:WD repeat-containing protein 7